MIESMIIALREGIEIALVLGILIVYLNKIGRPSLIVSVYTGLALALLASVGGAVVLQELSIDSESLEGFFMLAAAVFVISMIIWMWLTAKKIRGDIEARVNTIVGSSSSWKAHAGILSFTFLMIVREGIETAIFLQAVALSAGAWLNIAGTTIGLLMAAVFAVLFIRGSVRIDIGRFLRVTAVTLLVFTLQLILNAVHEFYEYGILPASPKMMGILGPIVQNNILFILAILSIPAIMLLIPGKRARQSATDADDSATGSTGGIVAPGLRQRRWQLSAGIASICIISFLGVGDVFTSNHDTDLSAKMLPFPSAGAVRIPVAEVSDNNVHRYSITDGGL